MNLLLEIYKDVQSEHEEKSVDFYPYPYKTLVIGVLK